MTSTGPALPVGSRATRLVAVRHGPVAAAGLCYGRYDVPTINPPMQDAAVALERLGAQRNGARRVVTSPSIRCLHVAELVAQRLALPLVIDADLMELSMGVWEGRRYDDLAAEVPSEFHTWMKHWMKTHAPGGETVADLEHRVRRALERVAGDAPELWFTHGGVIRCLRVILRGASWPDAMRDPVDYLTPTPFE